MGFWLWDSANNIVTELNINAQGNLHSKQYYTYWNNSGFTYGTGSETPVVTIPKSYLRKITGSKDNIYIVTNDSLFKYDSLSISQDVEANEHWDSPSGTGIYASVRAASFYLNYKEYDNTIVSNGISTAEHRFRSSNLRATFSNLYSSCIDMKNLVIRQADYYLSCWKNNSSEVWLPSLYSGGWFNTIPWFMSSPFQYISTNLYQIDVDANATGIALSPSVSTFVNRFSCNNVDIRNGQYGGLASIVATEGVPFIVDQAAFEAISGAKIVDVADEENSIYTPGGDTTDPYNPYPSGDSPATVDPLDSGVETDSPDTDGTWELPFDAISLDHARVDSSQAGVYRLVGLTQAQLQLMADYMFSDTSVGEVWENLMKLIYGNVVDTIIGIQEFPMDVADSVGTDIFCFIGRDITTGAFVGKALSSEYRSLDFGTIEVPRYSGTFYDFEPYTTLTLYIPYIGYIDMKPTEVVGSTLYINGWVHLSTGEVTVNVRSSRTGILGSYSGNIGRSLPISSADSTRLYAAIIETAAGIGGYASFGASASAMAGIEHADPHNMNVARGQYAQAVKAYGSAKRGVRGAQANMLEKQAAYEQAKEEFSSAKTAERQAVQAAERAEREFNEAGLEAYSNAIDAVTSGFEVVRGTHMTPGAGRTSPQVCFLRIEVPHQNVSKNQKLLGYPCNSAEVLNSDKLHGYTELRMIDLQIPGISLTELQELESILKGGFYLP